MCSCPDILHPTHNSLQRKNENIELNILVTNLDNHLKIIIFYSTAFTIK